MSQLTIDTNLPTISSVDGFITDSNMLQVSAVIEDSINNSGDAIGNIHGTGDYQYDTRKLINNIASTIGSELYDPAVPFDVEMTNVLHTIMLNGDAETYLPLEPTGAVTITAYDNLDVNLGELVLDTDFFMDGRKLRFKNSQHKVTVLYTGKYPLSEYISESGYRPNIIPNPLDPEFQRPTLTIVYGKIHVTVGSANA